jgi:hypothetical protein
MARELKTNLGNFPPDVKFEKKGQTFTGTLVKVSEGNYGKEFTFHIIDGDADIVKTTGKKDAKGNNIREAVDVKEGDEVRTEGTTQLRAKLALAEVGEKIKITFNGYKNNPRGGKAFKDYLVEVID